MLRRPSKDFARIARDEEQGTLTPSDAAREYLAVDPDYAPALWTLGLAEIDRGNLADAERLIWSGLRNSPARPEPYFAYATLLEAQNTPRTRIEYAEMLCFWKAALPGELPTSTERLIEPVTRKWLTDPIDFYAGAMALEARLAKSGFDLDPELAPYDVLNEFQRGIAGVFVPGTLERTLEYGAELAPLLHAAIREWVNDREQSLLGFRAACFFIALLGETGGPAMIADLLELAGDPPPLFPFVHWALHRLSRRFPEAALRTLRDRIAGAPPELRRILADHLNELPEIDGVTDALVELLADLPPSGDTPYLLAIVTDGLRKRNQPERARQLLAEHPPSEFELLPTLHEERITTTTLRDILFEDTFSQYLLEESG